MNDADRIRTNATDVVEADIDPSPKPERAGAEKRGRALIGAGLVGASLAVLCCATPLLAVLLPAVGLGGWLAEAGRVLLLLLLISLGVGVMALGFVRRKARTDACCETPNHEKQSLMR